MSKTPQAKISVGEEVEVRDVCSVEFRTRCEDNNKLHLTGGITVKVSDEFAEAVLEEYKQ